MLSNTVVSGLAVSLLTSVASAVDAISNLSLDHNLLTAPTTLQRYSVLGNSSNAFIYDFTKNPFYNFWPGGVANANAATFPALTGLGMTMATLNLGPCSMLPPHYHPRATNLVVAINGTTTTYMINENGAPVITANLTAGKMTIFPQGSAHMMFNNGCQPVQLISALNSDDPGTQNLANVLFMMNPEYLNAVFGYSGVDVNKTRAAIPAVGSGANFGSQECLVRCNLTAPSSSHG